MSTNPNPLQCLHDAIARIHHELRTRTWLSIHEVLGDDGQEYQTLNLRQISVSTSMQVWQEDRVHHTKNAKPAKSEINTTPPPPAIGARPPAVTDQASDLTPALEEANKAHNKQHKNIKQIIIGTTRSSYCLLGAKAIEPRSF